MLLLFFGNAFVVLLESAADRILDGEYLSRSSTQMVVGLCSHIHSPLDDVVRKVSRFDSEQKEVEMSLMFC